MNKLFPMPGCRIGQITRASPALLHVTAHGTRPGGRCPDCGRASRAVHSTYRRRPADLPSLGRAVRIGLDMRRFYCHNPACARRTFAEQLPELIMPHARRTCRLAETQGRVGIALSGKGAARLLRHLAMPASADTVLRLIRLLPLPEREVPRVVGVDDWAKRKGRTYGTIVVDLERHRVLDLLPDRAAETLAVGCELGQASRSLPATGRLSMPAALTSARRRRRRLRIGGTCWPTCARCSSAGWPLRWLRHRLLRRRIARAMAQARLRRLPVPPGPEALAEVPQQPALRTKPFPRSVAELTARAGRRARKITCYEEVRRRRAAGETLLAISRALGLAMNTLRKYAYAESFPIPEVQRSWPSIPDPYLAHLQARYAEGCRNVQALWRELRAMGFPGTDRQVQRWLAQHRAAPTPSSPPAGSGQPPELPPATQLAWLLIQPSAALSAADAATVARVEQDRETASVAALARRFTALVRACGTHQKPDPDVALAALDAWFADVRACGMRTIETFAAGLELDGAAVRAALTTPWSSGQAEGQITRLKLIKRQSYGRAGFDLLRRRVLLAA